MINSLYKKSRLIIFSLLIIVIVVYLIYLFFIKSTVIETTNNAYVRADITNIAPKISGFIDKVLVADNQLVKAGQPIVHIDDHDYQVALQAANANLVIAKAQYKESKAQLEEQQAIIKQAQAEVNSAKAEHGFAQQELVRYQHLVKQGGVRYKMPNRLPHKLKLLMLHY